MSNKNLVISTQKENEEEKVVKINLNYVRSALALMLLTASILTLKFCKINKIHDLACFILGISIYLSIKSIIWIIKAIRRKKDK